MSIVSYYVGLPQVFTASMRTSYPTHGMASEDFRFFVTAGDNGKLKRARDNTNAAVANIRRSTSTSKKLKTKDIRE